MTCESAKINMVLLPVHGYFQDCRFDEEKLNLHLLDYVVYFDENKYLDLL